MTVTSNQPENINIFSSTSFSLKIAKIPKFTFFCQRVSLPNLLLGGPIFSPNRYMDNAIEGDKLTSDFLSVGVVLDEDFEGYRNIYDWMVGLGFPDSHEQFADLKETGTKSDIQLFCMSNQNNPNILFTFEDAYPSSLGNLELDSTSDENPVLYDVGFSYSGSFKIEKL